MSQSTRGERITAAVSALAAIVILGAAVTAQQSRTAPVSRLARLESDLRFQLYLAHRTDGGRMAQRLEELKHTLDAWQKSPRTAADDELLAEWLEASIDLSMPGESGELPPTPAFSRPLAAAVETPRDAESPAVAKAPPTVAAPTPATTAKPVVEPEDRPPPSLPTKDAPAVAVAPVESKPAARVVAPPEAMERRPSDAPLTAKKPVVAAKPVAVNLAELNARIAGYHQGLAEVEAAIVAADGELDMARLTRLVEQVEQLAVQYELVRLYFDALTKRERASVTQPRSILPTIELVDRERAHLERGGESDFLAAFEVTADGKESPLAARLTAVAERMAPAEEK